MKSAPMWKLPAMYMVERKYIGLLGNSWERKVFGAHVRNYEDTANPVLPVDTFPAGS